MRQVAIPITNQYMFNRVMCERDICQRFLELVLGKRIDTLVYKNAEQAIEPTLNSHGVRLDIFARSENELYDIELQVQPREALAKRYRYYQAAIDTGWLNKGAEYDGLPESYIIFVCDHDPLDCGHPVYTIEHVCREDATIPICDGSHWIALNCKAYGDEENEHLADLMAYISTGTINPDDDLVASIAETVDRFNEDRKWVDKVFSVSTIEEDLKREARIMQRQATKRGLAEGREKGLAEGRAQGLAEGRAEGMAEGRAEGMQRYSELIECLFAEGRVDDIKRAADDPAYRDALFEELAEE